MQTRIHRNFSNYFLSHQDILTTIIETSTGQSVDKLLAVTVVLDEESNKVLDCLCLSNGKVMGFAVNVSDVAKEEED